MELLSVGLTATLSVIVMFVLVKLIGNRSISQMNMFDYINSITIGSIAAELATSDAGNMLRPLVAMVIFAAAVIVLAKLSCKSLAVRRVVEGRTVLLMKNGKLLNHNFKKAKIDVNEFLMQCRLNGYFDLSEIRTAVQESNGRISILPKATARPLEPSDLNLEPCDDTLYFNVILDGKILKENLKHAGYNEEWLKKELKKRHFSNEREIFVAVCNTEGSFYAYPKQREEDCKDQFDI